MTDKEDIYRFLTDQRSIQREYIRKIPRLGIPYLTEDYFKDTIEICMGHEYEYFDEYKQIFEWLKDNQEKGLFLIGPNGVGKTVLTMLVIPLLYNRFRNRIFSRYTAIEMNNIATYSEMMKSHLLVIDDIGTESICEEFSHKRMLFGDIMDSVEQKGKIFIGSTNLRDDVLATRYEKRTLDRIRGTTKLIVINHPSMRGKSVTKNTIQEEKAKAINANEQ